MSKLSPLEDIIYNDGERLIPGVTHDILELIRHRSTYVFFKKIIESDLASGNISAPVSIVDAGCGVGHGCYTLSHISGTHIVGVDISPEAIEYAKTNIAYQCADLQEFFKAKTDFDYIVSRHAFEHMPNGIAMALSIECNHRLMFEVPYDEPVGNPHHVLLGIREELFAGFSQAELFFQDLNGKIYDRSSKPEKPNGIICVSSCPGARKIAESKLSFPIPPYDPEDRDYRDLIEQCLKEHSDLQSLQQSRAVIFAKKLKEHPLLMKLALVLYSFMAKIYLTFRRSRD